MFLFGFLLGLVVRRPRRGRLHYDGKAFLFALWMTPGLLLCSSYMTPWPFFIFLALWIVGWVIVRAHQNWQETK